ncbi:MAG TPA: hypothetical protein VFZ31_09675 [Vicinamibacterales bacterium]
MIALLVASLLLTSPAPQSQAPAAPVIEIAAPGVVQELELNDGSSVIGRVESIGDGRFVFRTGAGVEMTVDVSAVRSLKPLTGRIVNGELWREDPNPTRLFFSPTGRSLKKGETYFGVYEILLPFVQVGITDRISIGGGTPLVFGDFEQPFWITPKMQLLEYRSTAVSTGVMHFFNMGDASTGIAYGVVTQGSTDSAATIGAGYAYARSEEEDAGSAVLMVGGEHRVSRRVKVVTENYAFKGGGFVSGGVRFFGEKLSADFGLVAPLFGDDLIIFPMINIVRKF